ncbi:DnaD domain-containing protein [Oceanobacillus oncorhynchi]|uniref:DnaD domain-containing protein n=1 Tax=Oceanobacillus oncorhynchi TaxID=545501 RepID=UPI00211651C7|nr:DnaD domain protein [Oceanobacillus oncorhynchi]UUI41152.1 DnaD domain protein [Oceanobacillus oncorhynchi]
MKGAFQTSREIFENPIWTDIPKFRIFFYIYGNAVFAKEGTTVAGMHLKRGQFLRSYRNLREDLAYIENRSVKKYSLAVIKRKIDSLVKENRLKTEESELGTLFTVVNYEIYQGLDNYKKENLEQRWNAGGTELEQGWNNNKNDKNVKNDLFSSSDDGFSEVMTFYQQNLQKGISDTPYNYELINQWFDEWNKDVLLAAMKVAAKAEAKGVSFIEGVLKKWKEAGVETIEDARRYEKEFKANGKQYKNNVVKIPNYGGEKDGQGSRGDAKPSGEFGDVQLYK